MEKMIVYHGSNVEVPVPRILQNGFYKDFGYGFYCTSYEKQAKRWAMTRKGESILNRYEYRLHPDLKVLSFVEMTDEWLDFVAACRHGESHPYDIVEGPMADDEIWDYVEDFLAGRITRDAFWVLARFKHPTHQIIFCTDKALQTIKFESSYEL